MAGRPSIRRTQFNRGPLLVPALSRLRLATPLDAPKILELVNESMANTFRVSTTADVTRLIDNAVISFVQMNVNEKIVGFIAAKDYPMIPSVHPSAWEQYIWNKYRMIEMNARNSLFIHLICWNSKYTREIVDNMLRALFMHDPYVQFIAMVKTLIKYPLLVPGQSRTEASFRRVQVMERGISGDQLPGLCVAERKEVCPRLRIRRAVEEDNDDIVPILERHSRRLRELYGDYYISELIARHPESERVLLVCEHKELAVGVMVLNTQINYTMLEECYELSPFAGLRHVDTEPVHKVKDLESNFSFVSDMNVIPVPTADTSSYNLDTMGNRDMKNSRVTWSYEDDEFKDFRGISPAASTTYCSPKVSDTQMYDAHLAILNLLDQEEEEIEFDIVNIDPDLMKLPDMFSPEDHVCKDLKESIHQEEKKETPKREKKRSSVVVKSSEPVVRYTGAPNAFLLELFAMHPDYDERYGFDMLEVAFELFPDRDYCVVCLPSKHMSFPLLEHFTDNLLKETEIVTPHCTQLRFIRDTLYVAHENSVRGDIRVRPGEPNDLPDINEILEHASKKEALAEMFETSLTSSLLDSYVLLSQNQPVGVLVIALLEVPAAIRTQYDLEPEPRGAGTDCTVLAGVMSPIMEPHSRWFMRDVLRLSRFSTLFWMCQPIAKNESSPSRNMMSLAERMTPVLPHKSIPNITGDKELERMFRDGSTPFSLWVCERPLTSVPKVYCNNSIVVVGASRTGLSFIETLVMGPTSAYLTFTNITLVSEHGLSTVVESLRAADTCVPCEGRYTERYLKSIPFRFYVDVMAAVMVNIDRKKKCIHLKGGGVKYYDELMLTCGKQFQHPTYMKEALELAQEMKDGKHCDRMLMDNPKYLPDRVPPPPELPDNLMLINSSYQANFCLRKLLKMISEEKEKLTEGNRIVVYGDCLEAYCCMAALLEMGINPKEIAFVEPFPAEDAAAMRVNCFNDESVDERVQESLIRLGVRIYRKCRLAKWRVQNNRVTKLRLMAPLHCIHIPCFAFFYYGLKAIDMYAFKAINECGLVYDGGLVVGPTFETNDMHIYGAGTCVQYSRRLYAAEKLHRYYNSEDIGEYLAQLVLCKMNPFGCANPRTDSDCPSDIVSRGSSANMLNEARVSGNAITRCSMIEVSMMCRWEPVKKFHSPIATYAIFPGPLYYLNVRKPGQDVPMEVQLTLPRQGHTLITDKKSNYFRLRLNILHCVDAVTCLSKKTFPTEIIIQLYGKHEEFFNKLLPRYQLGQIEDFYEFFTQPWMSALYQETFNQLLNDINSQDVGLVHDLVKSRFAMTTLGQAKSMAVSRFFHENQRRESEIAETFRKIIDENIVNESSMDLKPVDIPSECGQSWECRSEAAKYWQMVEGEKMVITYIAKYLSQHSVTNPHYAPPKPHDDDESKFALE